MDDKHLDFLLHYLCFHTDDYVYIQEIAEYARNVEEFRQMSTLECLLTLEKLVRDGYATEEIQKKSIKSKDLIRVEEQLGYFISFEGIQLWEEGGYIALREREKISRDLLIEKQGLERRQIISTIQASDLQRATFWATLITALAALGVSIFGLYKNESNVINPVIILQDTLIESKGIDTLQLKIQLNQSGDTLRKLF